MKKKKNYPSPYFIIKLRDIILNHKRFEFHDGLLKQRVGAAMGSPPVPRYANIFMAKIDEQIRYIAQQICKL